MAKHSAKHQGEAQAQTHEVSTETHNESPTSMTHFSVATQTLLVKDSPWSVEASALPAASVAYLLQYGFGKTLQDSASGFIKKVKDAVHGEANATNDEEATTFLVKVRDSLPGVADADLAVAYANAAKQERFNDLLSGTIGVRVASARPSTIDKFMRDIATERLRALVAKQNAKMPTGDKLKAFIAKIIEKQGDAIRQEAEARMAQASGDDLSLDDLLGE